jgi:hypothetical protein
VIASTKAEQARALRLWADRARAGHAAEVLASIAETGARLRALGLADAAAICERLEELTTAAPPDVLAAALELAAARLAATRGNA